MNDFVAQEKKRLQGELEKINEQLGILVRYEELANGEPAAAVTAQAPAPVKAATPAAPAAPKAAAKPGPKAEPAAGDAPKKRGRPKGSKNKPKVAGDVAGDGGDGKSLDLPTMLETIGEQVNKPLTVADFVTLVREGGYTTKAKDFPNMVYQALLKLCKKGTFKKNEETRAYEYVQKAA